MINISTIKNHITYTLLLFFTGSILYGQNDFDKPVLSSFTISPNEVDISSGVVTLTATVNAKDESGVATPSSYGVYTNYNGNQYRGSTWTLISGDIFDGVYESEIPLSPEDFGSGSLEFNVSSWNFIDPSGYSADQPSRLYVEVVNYSGTQGPNSGDGTESNPYQIQTFADLWWIGQDDSRWNKHYIQTADIDALRSNYLNSGLGWDPIGNSISSSFEGVYDGQGHYIYNLTINRPLEEYVGFFGYIYQGTIKNLRFENGNIKGKEAVGIAVGSTYGATLLNLHAEGSVNGDKNTGGLIGHLYQNSTISLSSFEGNVSGNDGDTSNYVATGGLVGLSEYKSTISTSWSDGSISGSYAVGGLVGRNSYGNIYNSYSTANVYASTRIAGGLIGWNQTDNDVDGPQNNFSTGSVSSAARSNYMGGFIGYQAECSSCTDEGSGNFWDKETSELDQDQAPSSIVKGFTTEEAKNNENYENWDFDNTWIITGNINDGYPILRTNNIIDLLDISFDEAQEIITIKINNELYEEEEEDDLEPSDFIVTLIDPDGSAELDSSTPQSLTTTTINGVWTIELGISIDGILSGGEIIKVSPTEDDNEEDSSLEYISVKIIEVQTPIALSLFTDLEGSFVSKNETIALKAEFSQGLEEAPLAILTSQKNENLAPYLDGVVMTAQDNSSRTWVYSWDLTDNLIDDEVTFTVSGTSNNGAHYSSLSSMTLAIDTVPSKISNIALSEANTMVTIELTEPIYSFDQWDSSTNEPNNVGGEDYALLRTNGKFNDISESYASYALIEINSSLDSLEGYTYKATYQGHNYFVSDEKETWENHRDKLKSTNAYLAVISTEEEAYELGNIAQEMNTDLYVGLYQDKDDDNYSEPNGGWKWVNGVSTLTPNYLDPSNFVLTIEGGTALLADEGITVEKIEGNEIVLGLEWQTAINGEESLTIDFASNAFQGLDENTFEAIQSNNVVALISQDTIPPSVSFTFDNEEGVVRNGDIVLFEALFSEELEEAPKLIFTALDSSVEMVVNTNSSTLYSYSWTASTSFTGQVTASLTASDKNGNSYQGTDTLSFNIKPAFTDFIYLDENEVTIKCENAAVGDQNKINDIIYTVVDETTLNEKIGDGEDVSCVCTSLVTNMSNLFSGNENFKQDISQWDTSNVTNMRAMFKSAAVTSTLKYWNTAQVTDMYEMFGGNSSFNEDISTWDTSSVEIMTFMFSSASAFNQNIGGWDTSSVTDISHMFGTATAFNQDISNWDTANIIKMEYVFNGAVAFNQDIKDWDISKVTNMKGMFYKAISFNQPISIWNVSSVTNMDSMFDGTEAFDQDLSYWCVESISSLPNNFGEYYNENLDKSPQWGSCPLENYTLEAGIIDSVSSTLCYGDNPVSMSVSSTLTGDNFEYQWQISFDNITFEDIIGAITDNYTPTSEINTDTFFRRITTQTIHGNVYTATTSSVLIALDYGPSPFLTAVNQTDESSLEYCQNETAAFTASGGTAYAFSINGIVVQNRSSSSTYSSTLLADGDLITAEVFSLLEGGCSATSSPLIIKINATPSVSIEAENTINGVLCAGEALSFKATTQSSSVSFEFSINGVIYSNSTTNTFNPENNGLFVNNRDVIEVLMKNESGCSARASMTITLIDGEDISITPVVNEACYGDIPASMSVSSTTAITSATYQWQQSFDNINFSNIIGATATTYTPTTAIDTVTYFRVVQTISNNGVNCENLSSSTKADIISSPTPVLTGLGNISLTGVQEEIQLCDGETAAFTASGGTAYAFSINGIVVQNRSSSSTYSSTLLADGDLITAEVFSLLEGGCSATSSPLIIKINATPSVSIEAENTINGVLCAGEALSFKATTQSSSVSFEFSINGVIYSNSTTNTFNPQNDGLFVNNGDVIEVLMKNESGCSARASMTITTVEISGGTISTSSYTLVLGETLADITVNEPSTTTSLTYQWQSSANNIDFTDIIGQSTARLNGLSSLNSSSYIRRVTRSQVDGIDCEAYTNVIFVAVTIDEQAPVFEFTNQLLNQEVNIGDEIFIEIKASEALVAPPMLYFSGVDLETVMSLTNSTTHEYTYTWKVSSTYVGEVNVEVYGTDNFGNSGQNTNTLKLIILEPFYDQDEDGIEDEFDQCPNTPLEEEVNDQGCSFNQQDDDQDGVNNGNDKCPNTPEGETVDNDGCTELQRDLDQDGIDFTLDECPETPVGQIVDEKGCAVQDQDQDLDGVPNDLDECPDTPINENVDEKGCAEIQLDGDLDGILNEEDECPETPFGLEVDEKGCSEKEIEIREEQGDDDQDGVINILDRCPETLEGMTVDLNGCSVDEATSIAVTDEDFDGVENEKDLCPNTEKGVLVNEFGCPLSELDSDFDKVNDAIDRCPNTPTGEQVDEYGCSDSQKENDFDLDGVENEIDRCSETPFGDEVDENGCSIAQAEADSDLDGIPNEEDLCPDTPMEEDVNENGCSEGQRDDDQDGVPNHLDRCEDTPEEEKVDQYGCSENQLDTDDDNDGVKNSLDKCPNTPQGVAIDENGCPYKAAKIYGNRFEQKENKRDDDVSNINILLGEIIIEDTNKLENVFDNNVELTILEGQDGVLFQLVGRQLYLVGGLDFEENMVHKFILQAKNDKGIINTKEVILEVLDIPNSVSRSSFNILVFNVQNEQTGSKVSYDRYYNPKADRGVGKWKIKKKIVGGNDAGLFEIKTEVLQDGKNEVYNDYLDFINAPDYENPMDHNRDNIYEVDVVNINTEDGDSTQPIPVTQTNIVVPENNPTAIELQSIPAAPTDDTDGDGVPDIVDNSPFVPNANQADSDGDGVGDVTDDADHDGVWNPFDECNDTPYDTIVDAKGCAIFYLSPTSFNISTSEKCAGQNAINIDFDNDNYQYNVHIDGIAQNQTPIIDSSWSVPELSTGDYEVCITVEGQTVETFQRCYTVNITDPQPLSVYGKSSQSGKSVNFSLAGGKVYTVTHNGQSFQTDQNQISIDLADGINQVKITTGIECQGVFVENYFNSAEVYLSPLPFNEQLNVFVGGRDTELNFELYTTNGRLIQSFQKRLSSTQRTIQINTDHLRQGSYILKTMGATTLNSELIIKD